MRPATTHHFSSLPPLPTPLHSSVVDCGDPGTPRYGSRSSLTVTTFGAAVTYTCNTGYILHGDSERRCLDNGQWSGTAVSCRGTV